LLQIQAKKSLKQWLGISNKKKIATMVRFPSKSSQTIIETTVGFLREKRVTIMVSFA